MVLDQPCCQFEPHIVCLREGQTLVVKNSGTIPHNTKIDSPGDNPSVNPLIPPGQSVSVPGWKADYGPSMIGCSIHGWMSGYVRVFNHPYFAVTDEDGQFQDRERPGRQVQHRGLAGVGRLPRQGPQEGRPHRRSSAERHDEVNFEVKPK